MEYFIIIVIFLILGFTIIYFNTERSVTEKHSFTIKQLMYVVSLSALSIVVGAFEIPFGITGVKFDFSEVIILVAYLLIGFKGASLVVIFRSLVRFVLPAKTGAEAEIIIKLIGEIIAILASFLLLSAFILSKKILKVKEKPLLVAVPTEYQNTSMKMFIVNTTLSIIFLTVGTTIFHVLFTMPIYTSVFAPHSSKIHFFITTFLKDSAYNDSVMGFLKFIIANFALLNIIKALLSSIIFLLIKPRLEKVIK